MVVGVSDGDTITVLRNKKKITIRLADIDCPEKQQPFGQKAKQFTSDMVYRKIIIIDILNTDRYGRIIANVFINNKNLCHLLLQAGLAWHYTAYSQNRFLAELEKDARKNRIGLWIDENPIPPWKFRKKSKNSSNTTIMRQSRW